MLAGLVVACFGKAGQRTNAQVLDQQVFPHPARDLAFKPVILPGKAIASLFELKLGVYARQDNGRIEWLGNVIHRAEFQTEFFVFRGSHGRDENDGDVLGVRVFSQAPKDFVPVHFGHHDIKQDQVRLRLGGGDAQGIFAGVGCAHAIVRLEQLAQHGQVLRGVVDDQDRVSRGRPFVCIGTNSCHIVHRKIWLVHQVVTNWEPADFYANSVTFTGIFLPVMMILEPF